MKQFLQLYSNKKIYIMLYFSSLYIHSRCHHLRHHVIVLLQYYSSLFCCFFVVFMFFLILPSYSSSSSSNTRSNSIDDCPAGSMEITLSQRAAHSICVRQDHIARRCCPSLQNTVARRESARDCCGTNKK